MGSYIICENRVLLYAACVVGGWAGRGVRYVFFI